jgi:hypothetical protein
MSGAIPILHTHYYYYYYYYYYEKKGIGGACSLDEEGRGV